MRRASLSSRLALEYPGVPPLLGVGDVQQRDKQGRELAQTSLATHVTVPSPLPLSSPLREAPLQINYNYSQQL